MSLLTARDLSVFPPGARDAVLTNLSLDLAPGEWLGVTGPNGGGKSSLVLGLAGLWPTQGDLRLDGASFDPHENPEHRRGLAAVLQDPSTQILQPTVAEEIGFGLRNRGAHAAEVAGRVHRLAEALGLDRELSRSPATLSAGRQQMVLLAAALATEPRLLVADEPTAHLDDASRRRVLGLIADEIERGLAVLWVTQLPDELALVHRTLVVGATIPGSGTPLEGAPSGSERLRIRVRVDEAIVGPAIQIEAPMELSIPALGITGIVGRNGVGKSVLLGAVAGHSPSHQVEVSWVGRPQPLPIATLQFPELQVFEESAADEVVYAAVCRGVARDRALDLASQALRHLGMDPERLLGLRTWALSTGEKRVLEVVGALTAPSSLCVLDEPTAGLDPERRSGLGRLVVTAASERPVLVASQDLDWLLGVGARVVPLSPDSSQASETPY